MRMDSSSCAPTSSPAAVLTTSSPIFSALRYKLVQGELFNLEQPYGNRRMEFAARSEGP